MNISRTHGNGPRDKAWYCLEFYDPQYDHHSVSVCYCTEHEATRLLDEANRLAPPTTHIYYWRADGKPVAEPPSGYQEGPLAQERK